MAFEEAADGGVCLDDVLEGDVLNLFVGDST